MEVTTERFIRKPLYVDAVRVTSQNFEAVSTWCDGEIQKETEGPRTGKSYIRVRVQYPKSPRQSKAFIGDWVLYTETGYKVYTNPSFRKSFDSAPVKENKVVAKQERPATPEEIRAGLPQAQDRRPQPPVTEEPSSQGTIEPGADLGTTSQGEQIEVVEATPQAIADAVNEQQPEYDGGTPESEGRDNSDNPVGAAKEQAVDSPDESTPLVQDHTPILPLPEPVALDEENAVSKIEQAGQPEPVSEQAPEDATAGKRVLSEEEQAQMGPDAVREMVSTGDVVLEQDLAA